MVAFFLTVLITAFIGYICGRGKWKNMRSFFVLCGVIPGVFLGLSLSFLGGAFFKIEVVSERYEIFPMTVNGKSFTAIEYGGGWYLLTIRDNNGKIKLIKEFLVDRKDFFLGEKTCLELKSRKPAVKNLWIWFFYRDTGIIEKRLYLKIGEDSFLKL